MRNKSYKNIHLIDKKSTAHTRTSKRFLCWTLRQTILPKSCGVHKQWSNHSISSSQRKSHLTMEGTDWTNKHTQSKTDSSWLVRKGGHIYWISIIRFSWDITYLHQILILVRHLLSAYLYHNYNKSDPVIHSWPICYRTAILHANTCALGKVDKII